MAIRFRFRSSLCFDSVDIEDRPSISVRDLKSKIVHTKNLNICQDFDLVLCDATTGQEYSDETFQLPSGSSVIIKRVPSGSAHSDMARGFPAENARIEGTNVVETSAPMNVESDNFDDFGVDLCPIFGSAISGSDLDVDKKLNFTNNESDKEVARFFEMPMVGCEKPEASELSEAIPRGIGDDKDTCQTKPKPSVGESVNPEIVVTLNPVAVQSIDLPTELKCSLCDTCFKEAVMIPCCQHSFCEKCILLVLIEKGRCPKCLSTKCRVENLLPNVSLRQAIERFLESQILMKSTDNAFGYAPDGESGIQVKEMSCAASIQQREELPRSPCTTGRGSNQVIAKPINANSSLSHKLKQVDGEKLASAHHMDLERRPEDLVADFQGENQPTHVEAESNVKKKVTWIHSAGAANKSFVETGRQRKGDRACYLCGSLDHFIRDCPGASNPYPMLQTGNAMFPGGVPGYLSPYWNRTPFPQMRPFLNPYGNSFSATMVPPTPFAVQPYMPSTYSSMAPYGGFAMMGGAASSVVPSAEWHHELQGYKKRQKISNNNLKRLQSLDDDEENDNIRKRHYYSEAKRSHDLKALRDGNDDLSHSRNSSTERSQGERHYSYFDDEPERSSSEVENMPCTSNWHSEEHRKHHHRNSKKHDSGSKRGHGDSIQSYHESTRAKDNKTKQAVSDPKREKHKQNSHESTRAKDDKRNQRGGDSIHSYHERTRVKDDKTKQVVSDSTREKKHKQNSRSESGLEPSISSDQKTRWKERESSHGSRHSRHNSSSMNNEHDNRWQMASGSDEDGEDGYYHKRKRLQ